MIDDLFLFRVEFRKSDCFSIFIVFFFPIILYYFVWVVRFFFVAFLMTRPATTTGERNGGDRTQSAFIQNACHLSTLDFEHFLFSF